MKMVDRSLGPVNSNLGSLAKSAGYRELHILRAPDATRISRIFLPMPWASTWRAGGTGEGANCRRLAGPITEFPPRKCKEATSGEQGGHLNAPQNMAPWPPCSPVVADWPHVRDREERPATLYTRDHSRELRSFLVKCGYCTPVFPVRRRLAVVAGIPGGRKDPGIPGRGEPERQHERLIRGYSLRCDSDVR